MSYDANPRPFGYVDPEDELDDALAEVARLRDANRLLAANNALLRAELVKARIKVGAFREPRAAA